MISPFTPFLEKQNVVILDGALGTELERRGADLRDLLWSAKLLLDAPDLIRQVHFDYYRSGANVATTASYQATIPGLMQRGLDRQQAGDVFRLSVRLAREARDRFWVDRTCPRPLVAASIGCYGAHLYDGSEFHGEYGLTRQQLIDWHRPHLEILAESGADLVAFETMPSLVEGEAVTRLLSEFPQIPAWLSFSCQDDRRLCHGESFAEAVQLTNAMPSIVAVGVNCTAPHFIEGLLQSAAGIAAKPLLVYPNSGESWDAVSRCWTGTTTDPGWATCVKRWHAAGARLIGGCCRTTPETIRTIAETLC
jgi:homocysteine S-methyltransferase